MKAVNQLPQRLMMRHFPLRRLQKFALLAALAVATFFFVQHLREKALHALPDRFTYFKIADPLPYCDTWKKHMPSTRDPATYRLYIEARKIWRSKIEWQLTHEEALRILTDVQQASQQGDWGARALMAYFYLHGLGPLDSNHVLDPDPVKAVEIARMAATAGQPWGLYDLGVAYEHGYGGAHYDVNLAWAYYLRAAQLGSPEAQMALANAYGEAARFDAVEAMRQCAYRQGHGAAALMLGVNRRAVKLDFKAAIQYFHEGVKFGSKPCAESLHQLFSTGYWIPTDEDEKQALKTLGIAIDLERTSRYRAIADALRINPDPKFSRLDEVLPLPPAKLPDWRGFEDALEPESKGPPIY
jgi:uncharacterized protein